VKGRDLALAGLLGAACLVGLFFLLAGSGSLPDRATGSRLTVAALEMDLGPEGEAIFARAVEEEFGTWAQPRLPSNLSLALGVADDEELARGRRTWRVKCLQCHGPTGAADGPTARMLIPSPRSFHEGVLKFTTTRAGIPPLREDLARVIRQGVPFTSMASFGGLPDSAVEELVSLSAYILVRGPVERRAAEALTGNPFGPEQAQGRVKEAAAHVAESWTQAREEVVNPLPPFPEKTAKSVARGRELFLSKRVDCAGCHGRNGAGNGPRVWDPESGSYLLRDLWGKEVRPRDLRAGQFHGGGRPQDLFRRVDQGIKGTPMNGFHEVLSPEEVWDLVHFIQALAQP